MNIPEDFLNALWETMLMPCSFAVGFSIGMLVHFILKGCHTFLTHTESFPELAAFTTYEQQRLLAEAGRQAFSALSFLPILVLFAIGCGGPLLALTLHKVNALPLWAAVILTCLFCGLGTWLGRRLEARRVRPFLRKLFDRQNGKSLA